MIQYNGILLTHAARIPQVGPSEEEREKDRQITKENGLHATELALRKVN